MNNPEMNQQDSRGDGPELPDSTDMLDVTSGTRSGGDDRDVQPVNPVSVTDDNDRRPAGWILAMGAMTVAFVLRLPAYFASRHLTFDDGVFASSILAMRDGGVPFRDVFSSQGPLFLPLAYVGDLIGGQSLNSPRVLGVVSGVAITVFVYAALARSAKPTTALYGALIAATSGGILWVSGPLAADGPALAFAALAFLLTLIHVQHPSVRTALGIGLAVGATMSIKSIHVPLLIMVAVGLTPPLVEAIRSGQARLRAMVAPALAGFTAIATFVVISAPFGIADVWDQTFRYRTETSGERAPLTNLRKIASTLWDRDLVLYLLTAVTIIWAITEWRSADRSGKGSQPSDQPRLSRSPDRPLISRSPDAARSPDAPLESWAPSALLLATIWLITEVAWLSVGVNPMWRAHVSGVVLPAILVLAYLAPPPKVLIGAGLVCIPLLWFQLDRILAPGPYKGSEAEVVAALRALPQGAWVLSDEPGLIWKSGHRTTDNFVDPSVLRIRSGRYDETTVLEAARDEQICAVVVRSAERFGSFPELGQDLQGLGFTPSSQVTPDPDGVKQLYVRDTCRPDSKD